MWCLQKSTTLSPADLKKEITQLTEEKNQLTEKVCGHPVACLVCVFPPRVNRSRAQIKGLQRKTASLDGFKSLLDATSALRKEQETETKLQERMYDQRTALSTAERRLADMGRRLGEARTADKVCRALCVCRGVQCECRSPHGRFIRS